MNINLIARKTLLLERFYLLFSSFLKQHFLPLLKINKKLCKLFQLTNQPEMKSHPPLNIPAVSMFIVTTIGALIIAPLYYYFFDITASSVAFYFVVSIMCGMSITAGYHRLWSHRSYEAHSIVQFVYMLFGAMSLQNSALIWSTLHRVHHKNVDHVDKDPYSINRGFWYAHLGWMLRNYPSAAMDFKNVPDLKKNKMIMFQHNHYLAISMGMNILFPASAGLLCGDVWGFLILGGFVRLFVNHHTTFFINSLAHTWGKRPYTKENTARDNTIIAFLTYGEGYHNFHHLFQFDYRNGIKWWHFDPTKWWIGFLSLIGMAKNLKVVEKFRIKSAIFENKINDIIASLELLAVETKKKAENNIEKIKLLIDLEKEKFVETKDKWQAAYVKMKNGQPENSIFEIEQCITRQIKQLHIIEKEIFYLSR